MNFGIIGVGKWGENYVRTFEKGVPDGQLLKVCTRKELRLENFRAYATVTDDYRKVIEDNGVQTVIIATQPKYHFKLSYAALTAGKNVICEKPCMFSEEEFAKIAKITQTGVVFFTNYIYQFASKVEEIKKSVAEDDNSFLNLRNEGVGPFRDYASLWDYGCHELFLAFYLNGDFKCKIESYRFNPDKTKHEIQLTFAKSKTAFSFGNGYEKRLRSISCSNNGVIDWIDTKEPLLLRMLESFIKGEIKTNLDYSLVISKMLKGLDENIW